MVQLTRSSNEKISFFAILFLVATMLGCTGPGEPNNGYAVQFISTGQTDAGLEICFKVTGPSNASVTVAANMVQGQLGAQFETIDLDETGMADVCFTLPLGMPGEPVYFAAMEPTNSPRQSFVLGLVAWDCHMEPVGNQ